MPKTRLAEQFKRIVADATSSARFREHLASDFTYACWGAGACLGAWQPFGLWEGPDGAHTRHIRPSGNVEIKEIYADVENAVVIACIRFIPIANPYQSDEVLHGVWIAHFNPEGSLSRLDDYSDIKFFDVLSSTSDICLSQTQTELLARASTGAAVKQEKLLE